MNVERCDHCERAFRNVRWVDLRTGELAGGFDHAARLCWDCQDVAREERHDVDLGSDAETVPAP